MLQKIAQASIQIRFVHYNMGQELIGVANTVVLDVTGQKVICDGKWRAVINEKQFGSTITKFHKFREHNSTEYHKDCADCLDHYLKGERIGCIEQHFPQPFSTGNPMVSMQVEHGMRTLRTSQEIFDITGASSLNPFQVEQVRQYLVGTRSLKDYQTWG